MKKITIVLYIFVLNALFMIFPVSGNELSKIVPPNKFQGMWTIVEAYEQYGQNPKIDIVNRYDNQLEINFRLHQSGAIQQIWTKADGKIKKSRGVKVIKLTENTLMYREWRFHRGEKKTLTLDSETAATLVWKLPKGIRVIKLNRNQIQKWN